MTSPRLLLVLTGSRLFFAAAFAISALVDATWLLLPLALLTELSDVGDGYIARRMGRDSVVGNVYDGMADHVSRMTEFVSLAGIGVISIVPVLVFLWRDGAVVTTRLLAGVSGDPFPATRASGKAKGIAQGVCIVWLAATQSFPALQKPIATQISSVVIWTAVTVTIISGLDYVISHRAALRATISG